MIEQINFKNNMPKKDEPMPPMGGGMGGGMGMPTGGGSMPPMGGNPTSPPPTSTGV
jgi:hypothetical protein